MKERTRHVCVCIASAFFRASPVLACLVFQNRQRGNPARQGAMSKWWNPDQLLNTTVEFEQSTSSAAGARGWQPSLTARRRSIHRLYLRPCVRPATRSRSDKRRDHVGHLHEGWRSCGECIKLRNAGTSQAAVFMPVPSRQQLSHVTFHMLVDPVMLFHFFYLQ